MELDRGLWNRADISPREGRGSGCHECLAAVSIMHGARVDRWKQSQLGEGSR